jgi:hypothetical protein
MNNTIIRRNDKFVCCWGYDQTQYSVYNVVDVKGKFVTVEGLNSWSSLGESDLAIGSRVKVYTFKPFDSLPIEEKQDLMSRGFNWDSYNYHYRKEAKEKADIRTITKVSRINGEAWTYIWELDNGDIVNSKETYKQNIGIEIVKGFKRCLVNTKYGSPSIKIDQCITASLDPDYNEKKQKYAEQNEYTMMNGR